MAISPAHKFGQIIGDILEESMIQYLKPIAEKHLLYLDYRHPRPVRNNKKEVRWVDVNGNAHKLDIVMEENGSESNLGTPRVFIEMAWRRYTKHSKNKAQEISGAIKPLIDKYIKFTPFLGVVIAGEFTKNSIDQMRSEGFEVVYISIEAIEKAFSVVGIDAHWEELTPEKDLRKKIKLYENLTINEIERIKDALIQNNKEQLEIFSSRLCLSLERNLESIQVVSIYGKHTMFASVEDACKFISNFKELPSNSRFYRFEISVRYSNGDRMDAQYAERQSAILFLRSLIL
ncbi:hypothetical protein FACS1894216_06010 [Synergistales bacterium]|nr:hypothetical protein FACS1894216_06010 [Synergistales bacterium]